MDLVLLSLCLGRTRVEETLTSSPMNYSFLSVAIQKQSFMMNYKHIYILNDILPKRCSKNNLQSGSTVASTNITNIKVILLRGLSREHIKV